jgi:hypothetical protein
MSNGGGAALPEDHSLTDEQRRDQEDHLVAAAHGERGSADPAKHSWMGRRHWILLESSGLHRRPFPLACRSHEPGTPHELAAMVTEASISCRQAEASIGFADVTQ